MLYKRALCIEKEVTTFLELGWNEPMPNLQTKFCKAAAARTAAIQNYE